MERAERQTDFELRTREWGETKEASKDYQRLGYSSEAEFWALRAYYWATQAQWLSVYSKLIAILNVVLIVLLWYCTRK